MSAMLPRVDLPEVILEVMGWQPGFVRAFTAAPGSQGRLADLDVSIAACLAAQALNIGYGPVADPGVEALKRDRLGHVSQTYMNAEAYAAANAPLIEAQARAMLAQAWGGGLVAAVGCSAVTSIPSRMCCVNQPTLPMGY